jgi:CDC6, C terminal.
MASVDMQVLRALRIAAAHDVWSTPNEIAQAVAGQSVEAPMKDTSITSAIRRLRTQGFIINHKKRNGRTREYSVRYDPKAI